MTTWFTAPAIGIVALVIVWPASAAPFANAPTAPSSLIATVEHDHSDSDGRRDARSDDRRSESDRDDRRSFDRAGRDDDRQGDGEGRRGGRGASFWLRSGDLRLEARCAPGEAMRACVDAALMLLDKAKSAQTQTPPPTASTPTSQAR